MICLLLDFSIVRFRGVLIGSAVLFGVARSLVAIRTPLVSMSSCFVLNNINII